MITLYYTFEKTESEEFIKKSLGLYLKRRDFLIKRTANGKPYVEDGAEFSLSHTPGLTICAVSDFPCGLDAEKMRSVKNKEKILARFLREEKRPVSDKEFLKSWTMFESRVKLFGERISHCPSVFDKKVFTQTMEIDDYIISVSSENEMQIIKERI